MAPADPICDALGQAVGLVPDHFGAQDETEIVYAPEGVAPGEAHEGFGWDEAACLFRIIAGAPMSFIYRNAGVSEDASVPVRSPRAGVLVAEVDPDASAWLENPHHLSGGRPQGLEELLGGGLGADLVGVVEASVLVGAKGEVRKSRRR